MGVFFYQLGALLDEFAVDSKPVIGIGSLECTFRKFLAKRLLVEKHFDLIGKILGVFRLGQVAVLAVRYQIRHPSLF